LQQFLILFNKMPSFVFPFFQIQKDLADTCLGSPFWNAVRERLEQLPQKPGGITVKVVYEKHATILPRAKK
jgi:hypothetical protein